MPMHTSVDYGSGLYGGGLICRREIISSFNLNIRSNARVCMLRVECSE